MTKEQAKHLAEVLKAYAEGKIIEVLLDGEWREVNLDEYSLDEENVHYRIKKEPKYRPFKNAEECFEEMQKHQPFGWIKCKNEDYYMVHIEVNNDFDFKFYFKEYVFTDDTPFGIKE